MKDVSKEQQRTKFLEPETRSGFYVDADRKALWKVLLDMYEEFRAVCEKHGIRYFAGFGTLLGAVRHKGFVPWDDEIDILMPRPDYDRFCQLAQGEKGGGGATPAPAFPDRGQRLHVAWNVAFARLPHCRDRIRVFQIVASLPPGDIS